MSSFEDEVVVPRGVRLPERAGTMYVHAPEAAPRAVSGSRSVGPPGRFEDRGDIVRARPVRGIPVHAVRPRRPAAMSVPGSSSPAPSPSVQGVIGLPLRALDHALSPIQGLARRPGQTRDEIAMLARHASRSVGSALSPFAHQLGDAKTLQEAHHKAERPLDVLQPEEQLHGIRLRARFLRRQIARPRAVGASGRPLRDAYSSDPLFGPDLEGGGGSRITDT